MLQALFFNGANYILDKAPNELEFGIDFNVWRTGDKFKGLKMIPPGLHFIYYRLQFQF